MNLETKIIEVELKENDILAFFIKTNEYQVNLKSEDSQNELKTIFSALLEEMIANPIKLNFKTANGYNKGLYIDVCTEYVKELNREINEVSNRVPQKSDIQINHDALL
ncbi:hypothetical protein KPL35_17470 [Clostridium sp. CF011]|uniref:hypothetical protein n=1 Tax=Clostridium sp. CF011 TaxID=2843318 RepID=UPI001C0AA535|nr:hypothetical protein [Clostridium sp. CF011]MBU3093824.1 hypothetical protein [Clostridium sp. CF011]WAG71746.1 hypothetical protein LL036_18420 [Clostridium sp. CF011]